MFVEDNITALSIPPFPNSQAVWLLSETYHGKYLLFSCSR